MAFIAVGTPPTHDGEADLSAVFAVAEELARHATHDLVIVNKPSGLVVHRGWARDRVVVMTLLRDQLGRHVYPVHRLDRGTSGALIFALSSEAPRLTQEVLSSGALHRRYLALVRGVPPESGTIEHAIPSGAQGKRVPAVTDYRRLFVFRHRYSLVEARPRTGLAGTNEWIRDAGPRAPDR